MKKIFYLFLLSGYGVAAQQPISTGIALNSPANSMTSSNGVISPRAVVSANPATSTNVLMSHAFQYLNGFLKTRDPAKAFSLYLQCAQQGNAKAMNAVAMQYQLGLGVAADPVSAASWFKKAAQQGYTRSWYNLGMMYKYGNGVPQDYAKAYEYFQQGSAVNDPSGWYGQGYMLYKGLGTTQNYAQAVALFKKGVRAGSPSCMYMLGLCYRNGYAVTANADLAAYWLNKASARGYHFATDELAMAAPENVGQVGELAASVQAAQKLANAPHNEINQYNAVTPDMDLSRMGGVYSGYLVQYDWSGGHVIRTSPLRLSLDYANGNLQGMWEESDSLTAKLQGSLINRNLVFSNTSYSKTDHYSPKKPVQFNFQGAQLQQVQSNGTLYLAGNVQLFSPDRDEPEKPVYIILTKTAESKLMQADISSPNKLRAYPNPFVGTLTIGLDLAKDCEVSTQVFTADGKLVYSNAASTLAAGSYNLPVQLSVPAGTYVVKQHFGNDTKSVVVVKQ